MQQQMSACGVLCSGCAAFRAASKGSTYQAEVAGAWENIYGLKESPERVSCGGCLGPEEELFHTSKQCAARQCCRAKGLGGCAGCAKLECDILEKAQSTWDGVPERGASLSQEDFDRYARAYCGHRERLRRARSSFQSLK